MDTQMRIRDWLRKKPEARVVICTTVDGKDKRIAIQTKSPRRFFDAEQTIAELGATMLEAQDEKGNTLRRIALEPPPEATPAPEPPPKEHPSVMVPSSLLSHFSDLLAANTKQCLGNIMEREKNTGDRFGDFIELVLKRLDNLELRTVKQMNAAERALRQRPPGEPPDDDDDIDKIGRELATSWLRGKMQGEAAAATNGTTPPAPEGGEPDA
jgi:hypothetical protein